MTISGKGSMSGDNTRAWGQQHQGGRRVLRGLLHVSRAAGGERGCTRILQE